MYLLLQYLEVNRHFPENFHSILDHEVIDGLWVLVARPHDSLELKSGVDELLGGVTKDV